MADAVAKNLVQIFKKALPILFNYTNDLRTTQKQT